MSRLERIVAACGGVLLDGGTRALIPGPDHSARDRSVSLMESDGRLIIHCFSPKDDWRSVRGLLIARGLLEDGPAPLETEYSDRCPALVVQPQDEDRSARARRFWDEGKAINCSPASAYLRRRCVKVANGRSALRFHPRMTSLDDRRRRPALLATIVDANGELQGVQATLLTKHGTAKAPVPTPRRVIGKLVGGAVRLSDANGELAIGEGVESTLSAAAALGLPAWAMLTAYNLSQFNPPAGVARLVIAADNDEAGRAAAAVVTERCADRLDVSIHLPPDGVLDWNDWARRAHEP